MELNCDCGELSDVKKVSKNGPNFGLVHFLAWRSGSSRRSRRHPACGKCLLPRIPDVLEVAVGKRLQTQHCQDEWRVAVPRCRWAEVTRRQILNYWCCKLPKQICSCQNLSIYFLFKKDKFVPKWQLSFLWFNHISRRPVLMTTKQTPLVWFFQWTKVSFAVCF